MPERDNVPATPAPSQRSKQVPERTISDECKYCAEGEPEWSTDASCWIHRRPQLDKRCTRKMLTPIGELPAPSQPAAAREWPSIEFEKEAHRLAREDERGKLLSQCQREIVHEQGFDETGGPTCGCGEVAHPLILIHAATRAMAEYARQERVPTPPASPTVTLVYDGPSLPMLGIEHEIYRVQVLRGGKWETLETEQQYDELLVLLRAAERHQP